MVDLLCDALSAKIEQLQEEKAEELNRNLLEKIPECPVNIQLHLTFYKLPSNVVFVIVRFVLKSSGRTKPSSAARLDTISVEPAKLTRPSR